MGREEEREILSGSKPEPVPEVDLERASGGAEPVEVPPPDRRGLGDETQPSAFEAGSPDAIPTDVTDSAQYQDELAEVRRRVESGEAVVEDGRERMPPTRYETGHDE